MPPRDLGRSLQRSLTHLQAPATRGGKFAKNAIPTHFRSNPPFVHQKDRIPFWHVAPGDRVKLVKGGDGVKGKVGVVDRVDREANRVFLKEPEFAAKKRQFNEYPGQQLEPDFAVSEAGGTYLAPRSYHVSNVRLQVRSGEHEYTATRVRKTKVTWDRRLRRFSWKRYALVPELGGEEGDAGWRELPWPKEDVPETQPGVRDVEDAVSLRTSWIPSLASLSLSPSSSKLSPRNPTLPIAIPEGAPQELQVGQLDLGGAYWSRAKRTERHREKKEGEKAYGKGVMREKARRMAAAADLVL